MTCQKSFRTNTFALIITLATGTLANAQGTASQPALESSNPETDPRSEAQKPADAVTIHEGAGPIDCASLLAQEDNTRSNTQSGNAGGTDGTSQSNSGTASNPYRENQPSQDTQISTLEECRAQQNADSNPQPSDVDKE